MKSHERTKPGGQSQGKKAEPKPGVRAEEEETTERKKRFCGTRATETE